MEKGISAVTIRYNNINALRSLSAIGIVMMHYLAFISNKPDWGIVTMRVIPWFSFLTCLFFMISAFSVCCGYYERFKNGQITPKSFYIRRYARILPFFTMLTVIDLILNPQWGEIAQGFMNITLAFNLLPNSDFTCISGGWFLGLIFLFYMLFPFFVFLCDNKYSAWTIFFVSIIINFLCQYYFFTPQWIGFRVGHHNMLFSAVFFLAGGLIYLYRDTLSQISTRHSRFWGIISILIVLAYFIVPQGTLTLGRVIPSLLVFIIWLVYSLGADKKWMHNKVMDYLSNISMEIYLSHMMMFRLIEKIHLEKYITNASVQYIVTCILGLALAIAFSYYAKKTLDVFMKKISFFNLIFR